LEIVWPRVWTAADMPDETDPEVVSRMTRHDSFLSVMPHAIMRSGDLDDWLPVDGVRMDESTDTAVVPLVGDGRPIYVCTQIPYRPSRYLALLDHVRGVAPKALHEIGRSQAGQTLYMVNLPATDCPFADAPTVYVQALQHCDEFTGGFVVDALLRELLDEAAGPPLRRRINWQIMPMLDVDGLHGLQEQAVAQMGKNVRRKNPNRDWDAGEWPEVAAVRQWWRQQIDAGCRYAVCFDLHNGWSNRRESGACYTIFVDPRTPPEHLARQRRFIDFLYERTDHETGKYWGSQLPFGMTCKEAFYRLTGSPLSYTVEFSRHVWWDRALQAYVPSRPDYPRRYARDVAKAVVEHLETSPSSNA
jgi:hypothetical protein